MRSPVPWLLLIIAVFFGWYTNDYWLPSVQGLMKSVGRHVPETIRPGWIDNTETVYKWKDAQGKWHVSNEPPKGVSNYEAERVSLDDNVLPPPGSEKKTRVRPARKR